MKINRNMSAVKANNQLLRTENKLSISMQKLSSGYKINSAKDNPAGMAISNKMRAQIAALDQAKSNASDAENVMEIADGALNEVSSILQRMRELSVQAANDTNSDTDVEAIQQEIEELSKEVDRISDATEYNTKTLLDGSSDTRVYARQVAADGTKTQLNTAVTRVNISEHVESDTYGITVESLATKSQASIASAQKPAGEGTISINGVSVNVTDDMTDAEYLQALKEAATKAGTTMTIDVDSITFESNNAGSSYEVEITISDGLSSLATAEYKDSGDGSMTYKGTAVDAQVSTGENLENTTIRTEGNRVYIVGDNGFSMDFLVNEDLDMSQGNVDLELDVTDIGNMTIHIGANENQEMEVKIPEVSIETLYLDTVNVSVAGGAARAIATLDEAISYVSDVRSRIGAFQNRLEYAQNSLAETSENMTEANSNLMDTDMASEMTEYTSQNILDQAGISVLSQANDLPQQVLSLLSR